MYVTAFYAALLGLLCVVLSNLVVRQRVKERISLGDGGNAAMTRLTRIFGNFAEYAALFIVMLALAEAVSVPTLWLHVFGSAFVVGRLAHAIGLYRTLGINPGRTIGMLLTYLTLLGLAVALLTQSLPKVF